MPSLSHTSASGEHRCDTVCEYSAVSDILCCICWLELPRLGGSADEERERARRFLLMRMNLLRASRYVFAKGECPYHVVMYDVMRWLRQAAAWRTSSENII